MSRFEIEDIISQDKRGIVFCAHDSERGHTVALRRFFPFGQDGGGLSEEESAAFVIAAKRLDGVEHDALRSVIAGAVDPIDGMPYIVAEWIDGGPLETILTGGKLEPPQVIEVLRLALEVSLTLSEALGEESVWVETEADSIFIGSEESCRGYVFWLSPFKWLGAEFGSRKLSAIVDLGERLAGWKGKLISDSAGNGLGGWLKWMRNNPDARLAEALQAMPIRMTESDIPPPPPPEPAPAPPVTVPPVVEVKPPSSSAPVIIAVAACLVLAIGGLAVYQQRFAKAPSAPTVAQAEAAPGKSPATPKPAPVAATPERTSQPVQDEEAIAAARINEMAEKLAREKEAARESAKAIQPAGPATKPAPQAVTPPTRNDFTPGEGDKMQALKMGDPASVTGVVLNVRHSKAGNSLYFDFSNPAVPTEIMAVAHKSGYPDDFLTSAYKDLIGKKVRFDGTVFRERSGRQYVKISSKGKIRLSE